MSVPKPMSLSTPSGVPVPPARYFLARTQLETMQMLQRGLAEPGCFLAVTGEAGLGKTTVLHAALAGLPGADAPVRHASGPPQARQAVDALLDAAAAPKPSRAVLVFDNAQDLALDVLRDLSTLASLAPARPFPWTVAFVARPEFWLRLNGPSLSDLREAITVRTVLFPMPYLEAEAYVEHLLQRAGSSAQAALAPGALRAMLLHAQGNPRRINAGLEAALASTVANRHRPAPRPPGLRAAGPQPGDAERMPWRKPARGRLGRVSAACAVCLAGAAVLLLDDTVSGRRVVAADAMQPPSLVQEPPASRAPSRSADGDIEPEGTARAVPTGGTGSRTAQLEASSPASGAASALAGGFVATEPAPQGDTRLAPKAVPDAVVALLVTSGDAMLGLGDVVAAQLLYERAALAGSAQAAFAIARIHDPKSPLSPAQAGGDAAVAAAWYRRAAALGHEEADAWLQRLNTSLGALEGGR